MHHLSDDKLKDSIKRQYEISNLAGIICHSFWKGERSEVYKGLFVNYHSDLTIKSFFGRWFEVLLMEEYKEFDPQDSILLIGKKKRVVSQNEQMRAMEFVSCEKQSL